MARFKVKKNSTWVDMTPMCDVAFLLLSFFVLTAKFKPSEIVTISPPTSSATEEVADKFVTFTIDKDGKVFMAIGKQAKREQIFDKFFEINKAKYANIPVTPAIKKGFAHQDIFGSPISQLPSVATKDEGELRELFNAGKLTGIPTDSTNNQLGDWIMAARYVYAETENEDQPPIAIKGDKDTNIKGVKRVIDILKEKDVNRYKLITVLESGGAN
ncbi:MAG: biopolymer transporter ExbD [Chitinophagales bacterium]|nr:biopolymer transporter ExbD [Bacteroidota bacterium]